MPACAPAGAGAGSSCHLDDTAGALPQEIKAFVAADPYVINGLVADSVVRPLGAVVPR